MPTGICDNTGKITITYNPSCGDSLLVGNRYVLPCYFCGDVYDFALDKPIITTLKCDACLQISNLTLDELKSIHNFSFKNRPSLEKTDVCGCFYCLQIFHPSEIKKWHEENRVGGGFTALCPKYGIDSILPKSEKLKITKELLQIMHDEFF